MALFDLLKKADINAGIESYRQTAGALLLDVRTPAEYREGHIPGSQNLPLQSIGQIAGMRVDYSTPLFVHCLSGGRSRQAVFMLRKMGYQNVSDIGGIADYRGKLEV